LTGSVSDAMGAAAEAILREAEPIIAAIVGGFRVPGYDRDDLAQEARLHLIRCSRSVDPDARGSLRKWIRVVVTNKLIDLRRAEMRRLQPTLFDGVMQAIENAAAKSPSAVVRFASACTDLQRETMAQLAGGLSQAEIGRRRGVSRQAVHRVVVRLRRKTEMILCAE